MWVSIKRRKKRNQISYEHTSFVKAKEKNRISFAHTKFDKIKEDLCNEFSDFIRDKLPEAPMKGPPMTIPLAQDDIPSRIHTARQIPKHLQKEADDIVDELITKGIIAHVEKLTEWTSAAFFVPKPNAVKGSRSICLVTDLSKLNRYI